MIEISKLTMSYGTRRAVDALDLTVRAGEVVALLGPNGAGKTTTLSTLSGLLRPQSGVVRISGADVILNPRRARAATAYIPDKPHLYELLTAWEYLEFVAGLWDLPPKGSWRAEVERRLVELGIFQIRHDLIESFSHGMRQKLLLVAGLLHDPDVWILDEPMSGLDPRAARQMQDILRSEATRGAAVLLSTHILDVAERMCDRIAILDHGKKVAEGTIEELRHRQDERLEDLFLRLTPEDEV